MKKILTAAAITSAALALAACGSSNSAATTATTAAATTAAATTAAAETTAAAGETKTGEADGFGGKVTVSLTMDGDKITAATITGDGETADIGAKAIPELEKQVVAANGADIDGVSGATVTSTAVKNAVASALGVELETEAAKETETAAPAENVAIEGGLQIGSVYEAAHGTKCFTQAVAVVKDDTIVAAYIDDFQFMAADGTTAVPNSDGEFGKSYADASKVLASKRANNEAYSQHMAEKAQATQELATSYDAIQSFVVGKTIDEVLAVAGQDNAVDAVSGATLADTANYLKAIADAATAAKDTQAVEFTGNSDDLKLNVVLGAAHGDKCFSTAVALTDGTNIILSYIDEFQPLEAAQEGVTGVPNSTDEFGAGFTEGTVLGSKRVNADYYSKIMTEYAKATVRIDDNYDAIQAKLDGMSIADAEALSGQDNAVDSVSGATLADTKNYIALVVSAAKM